MCESHVKLRQIVLTTDRNDDIMQLAQLVGIRPDFACLFDSVDTEQKKRHARNRKNKERGASVMKKLVALLLSVMMCFACVSALADTYVSWYTYGDVYLSSVRSEMEADFAKLNLTINGSDANGNQQVQSDFISTALMNNDCEAIVVNLVESGAISTAQTIMNQIQAAGIPTVWFNRPVSTNNEEAANLFLNNPASAFVGTNFEDAGVMQGELIGQYLVEHYNDIDLNGDGKISYIMFKGDEANQEAIARTALAVEYANKALVAAGKPEIEFYDASNANKYLVDPNGSWSNVFSSEQMQTVLSMYNEGNGNMVELVICNNDDMAYGAVMALQNAGYNHGEGTTAIPVFGVDATDVAKDLINNGYMVGTIKQDNVGMADAVATITANLIAGKENKFEGLNENYVIVDNWFVQIPYAVYTGE